MLAYEMLSFEMSFETVAVEMKGMARGMRW
jgi:hypothetical protein